MIDDQEVKGRGELKEMVKAQEAEAAAVQKAPETPPSELHPMRNCKDKKVHYNPSEVQMRQGEGAAAEAAETQLQAEEKPPEGGQKAWGDSVRRQPKAWQKDFVTACMREREI